MPVHNLYHRRKLEAERGQGPEVYTYDELPAPLREQLKQIFRAAIGSYSRGSYGATAPNNNKGWAYLADALRRDFGVHKLAPQTSDSPLADVLAFIKAGEIDLVLSAVELLCRYIDQVMRPLNAAQREIRDATEAAQEALNEINTRFKQAGVGYAYVKGDIVRVDSQLVHAEVVKPALALLADPRFKGAEEEFREAYRKHRAGDDKGAVTDANCAFESTLKAICDIHGWTFDAKARGSDLLKVVRAGGLFPDYLEKSFEHMQALLTSGLPSVRNNAGSHGQGATPKDTPTYVGAYALHLAAANIVYLCEASRALEAAKAGP
jgi:hypothetical protein